ncbi:putative glutamate receptor like protein [Argiope bruennichi]|uniref:Putative glutamate receptor like protein n=1 Tax=Argiope bruennichi TaxID=94029 RepID=A0A8T0G5J6_ARGBR|nr:putative glutamate receptor like protein [Argiope bruennichi]
MRTVRIAVSQWAPWIQFDANYSLDSAKGVLIELYSGMKQTKIFDYELQMIKAYGVLGPDKKWTGMVGSALRNETDILGPFLIDEGRGSAVQFLSSLDFSELAMATGLTSAGQNPFVVFRVFSAEVWLLFLSAIIFATTVVFLIQSLLPYPCEKGKIQSFLRYFWLFTMSLFGKDFGAKRSWYLRHIWNSRSFRFIQSVWLMTCIIFVNTYQGNITSNFASNKFKPRYETLEDVMSDSTVEIKTYANSFPLMCLSKLNNTSLRPIWLRVKRSECRTHSCWIRGEGCHSCRRDWTHQVLHRREIPANWQRKDHSSVFVHVLPRLKKRAAKKIPKTVQYRNPKVQRRRPLPSS